MESYKAINREHFTKVKEIIVKYQLPVVLSIVTVPFGLFCNITFGSFTEIPLLSVNIISDDNIEMYTSLSDEDVLLLKENPNLGNTRGLLWTALVWLYNAWGAISTGCSVIEGVSGEDVCGYIADEAIKSLVASGTRKRFKVLRYVEKKYCPYPPHSYQCNVPPYAYWETKLQAY